jgi:hypothetical protein
VRGLFVFLSVVAAPGAFAQAAAPCASLTWSDGGLVCVSTLAASRDAGVFAVDAGGCAEVTVIGDQIVCAGEGTDSDAGTASMEIEAFEPVSPGVIADTGLEQFEAPSTGPTVAVTGSVQGTAAIDTTWESPPNVEFAENVWDGQLRARLGVDVKINAMLRLFVEGKAWVRAGSQRDFDRSKAFFEPMLGEAFVDLYTERVDVRVGNQRIAMGANAALAPADALNPKDFRVGLMSLDPDDGVVPVFAIRARGEIGKVAWMAAYAPFFTPSRFVLFGQDEALLQPALAPALPTRRIDPTLEDVLPERLLETKRPPAFLGDVALRLVSTGKIKVGASWAWINEKLPQVTIDPELQSLLSSQASGRAIDPAVAVSVQNRFSAGETLFRGEYERQHIFSAEASMLLGPGQLDLDVSYSPRQTFFDAQFAPISKSAVTWVVGYSTAQDSKLIWAVSYLGMVVPNVRSGEQLLLVEPATAVGADRAAWFHLLLANVSYTLWEDRFVVELSGGFEPVQRSFTLAPRVTFQGVDKLKLWVGADIFEGSPYSPLGYFGRNDQISIGARYELF